MPPVTNTPDHVLLVLVLVTLLLLASVNFQLEKVLPVGPVAVHVVVPPRVTDEGEQLNFATNGPNTVFGHLGGFARWSWTNELPVALPPATVCNLLVGSVASTPSDCPQCPAYSLQSLAEHFRVHSHADTEVIGQTEKMSWHG